MLKPKPGIQHRNLVAVHFFYPCTINVVHHLRVFMPHLIGYKRRVCASRQEPAGKSMPRMVRIPAANASAFYCSFPSAAYTAVRVAGFLLAFPSPRHENKSQILFLALAVFPVVKRDSGCRMTSCQFMLRFERVQGRSEQLYRPVSCC